MKKSESVMREEANSLSIQINKLGGSRVLRNELFMLGFHRNKCSDHASVVADYDQRIMAKKWALQECLELEELRAELNEAIA
tara:strand:- start:422 stop:667 length:246 start_codon:yes stop_codon:yes gene_type:complete